MTWGDIRTSIDCSPPKAAFHPAVGARLPTTPEHRPDRCFLPDLAELGPHRRIGPDSHARVSLFHQFHPNERRNCFPFKRRGMDYKGKVGKNSWKTSCLIPFILAIKIGFWLNTALSFRLFAGKKRACGSTG